MSIRPCRPVVGWLNEAYKEARHQYHYAILRLKRDRQKHLAENFICAAMQGDVELLKEMKRIKNGYPKDNIDLPTVIDNVEGSHEIAEMFRNSYSTLFNSAPTDLQLNQLLAKLNLLINELSKVTGSIVKEAVMKLKPGKTDVSGSFVSDALKNAPDNLFINLAKIFKSWLYHGSVTSSLLACSFMPLLKSNLKDVL